VGVVCGNGMVLREDGLHGDVEWGEGVGMGEARCQAKGIRIGTVYGWSPGDLFDRRFFPGDQKVCCQEVCCQEVCCQEVCCQEVCCREVCCQEVCRQEICGYFLCQEVCF
jgi:hypothetical protein